MIKKILVVDDEDYIRELIAELLTEEGFEVEIAQNGADALKIVEDFQPDYIISDVRMPICDGIDLLKKLNSLNSPLIPVLLISGFVGHRELYNLTFPNYMGFMEKPLNMKKILKKLREH